MSQSKTVESTQTVLPPWETLKAAAEAGKRAERDYGQSFIRRMADKAMFEEAVSPDVILRLLADREKMVELIQEAVTVLGRAQRFIAKVDDLHQTIYSNALDEDCEEMAKKLADTLLLEGK